MGRARLAFTVLVFGYAFLYLPIALVMVYSFNESRLVTVWAGFSTKWWSALAHNDAMLLAAWLSLRIALVSAAPSRPAPTIANLACERAVMPIKIGTWASYGCAFFLCSTLSRTQPASPRRDRPARRERFTRTPAPRRAAARAKNLRRVVPTRAGDR